MAVRATALVQGFKTLGYIDGKNTPTKRTLLPRGHFFTTEP